ncbi:MAG: RNA-binding S4 domain-containing protein [Candidatus Sumerlaeia bacterium]|nr:RNA-binding S4 domain-containing protein [Candidatus Sumerlaeia bacterium]
MSPIHNLPKRFPQKPREIAISPLPIELAKLLKFAGLVDSGGVAKQAVIEGLVMLNGEVEIRRGKKIYHGDVVEFAGTKLRVVDSGAEQSEG